MRMSMSVPTSATLSSNLDCQSSPKDKSRPKIEPYQRADGRIERSKTPSWINGEKPRAVRSRSTSLDPRKRRA